jgi:hypothetical protein
MIEETQELHLIFLIQSDTQLHGVNSNNDISCT